MGGYQWELLTIPEFEKEMEATQTQKLSCTGLSRFER